MLQFLLFYFNQLIMKNRYVLIEWPEVQDLMDTSWFDEEAILNFEGANSSYFIPENRITNRKYEILNDLFKEILQSFTKQDLLDWLEMDNKRNL